MDKSKSVNKNKINELPKTNGVYLFYASAKTPVYIGKAINIQARVKNHFMQSSYRDDLFIDKVNKIGYLETKSEIEALILEASLIKKYQPKYNVTWRDDKNYFYVAIDYNKEKIPYVYMTHQPFNTAHSKPQKNKKPTTKYIGPFTEGTALKKALRFLRRAFPYYASPSHPKLKCTWCHLDLCPGPNPDLKFYRKNIKKFILVLQGKRKTVLNFLKKEMKQLSKERKFEEAGKTRDQIFALRQIMLHAHVIENAKSSPASEVGEILAKIVRSEKPINRIECYDVSNIQGKQATGSMVVFVNGEPDKSRYKKFGIKTKQEPNDIAMLKEVLQRRFKHTEWQYPDAILIDGGKAQLNIALKTREQFHRIVPRVISIAKGKQELFIEGKRRPILLKSLPQAIYNLIKQLDDEAHRFAISYHKKLRKNDLLG